MNLDSSDFWNRVKLLIKQQNTTQEWIANQCEISLATLHNQIARKVTPSVFQSYKIAQALNTTVEYLVTGIDNTPKQDNSDVIDLLNKAIQKLS